MTADDGHGRGRMKTGRGLTTTTRRSPRRAAEARPVPADAARRKSGGQNALTAEAQRTQRTTCTAECSVRSTHRGLRPSAQRVHRRGASAQCGRDAENYTYGGSTGKATAKRTTDLPRRRVLYQWTRPGERRRAPRKAYRPSSGVLDQRGRRMMQDRRHYHPTSWAGSIAEGDCPQVINESSPRGLTNLAGPDVCDTGRKLSGCKSLGVQAAERL